MVKGIRTGNFRGFNKGHSSKFRVGCQIRQTSEEGRSTYRPKRCGNNNKDEDSSSKTLNDKKFHPRNHYRLCLFTKRFITPQKIYIQALSNQTQNPNINISPTNKRCGVVIMRKQRYFDKINSFLEDTNIYEICNSTTINKDIISFNKLFRKHFYI